VVGKLQQAYILPFSERGLFFIELNVGSNIPWVKTDMASEHESSPTYPPRERTLIMGAGGRDFHVRGKRVLVIEDRPTLTHGEMGYGSGTIAAQRHGTTEIVDPSPFTRGSLVEIFARNLWVGRSWLWCSSGSSFGSNLGVFSCELVDPSA
jgi:hypothetical protein